ncbi:uncharacterized protein LOC128214325 isoform X2 [Mya arenaria]|uniref:uncharacterized protein LOC128214325 isoform X2 n=1 Tax=Mya arenaria TaxID=6604 RepID=UPI0022E816E5|nr:uncharacterized protein LOC128214325 isoform X2 [Mya arenaria]
MDVIHDEDAKLIMAIIGDVSQQANGIQTVNLHDYNTGETNEVHYHKLSLHPNPLIHSSVERIAGLKIASFCYDYTTFYADVTPTDPKFHGQLSNGRPVTNIRLQMACWT